VEYAASLKGLELTLFLVILEHSPITSKWNAKPVPTQSLYRFFQLQILCDCRN